MNWDAKYLCLPQKHISFQLQLLLCLGGEPGSTWAIGSMAGSIDVGNLSGWSIIFPYAFWRYQGRRRAYLCDRAPFVFMAGFDILLAGIKGFYTLVCLNGA